MMKSIDVVRSPIHLSGVVNNPAAWRYREIIAAQSGADQYIPIQDGYNWTLCGAHINILSLQNSIVDPVPAITIRSASTTATTNDRPIPLDILSSPGMNNPDGVSGSGGRRRFSYMGYVRIDRFFMHDEGMIFRVDFGAGANVADIVRILWIGQNHKTDGSE